MVFFRFHRRPGRSRTQGTAAGCVPLLRLDLSYGVSYGDSNRNYSPEDRLGRTLRRKKMARGKWQFGFGYCHRNASDYGRGRQLPDTLIPIGDVGFAAGHGGGAVERAGAADDAVAAPQQVEFEEREIVSRGRHVL